MTSEAKPLVIINCPRGVRCSLGEGHVSEETYNGVPVSFCLDSFLCSSGIPNNTLINKKESEVEAPVVDQPL